MEGITRSSLYLQQWKVGDILLLLLNQISHFSVLKLRNCYLVFRKMVIIQFVVLTRMLTLKLR